MLTFAELIKQHLLKWISDQTNIQSVIHWIRSQLTQSKQVQKLYCDRCDNWHTKQQICTALRAKYRNVDEETTLQKYVVQGQLKLQYPKGDTFVHWYTQTIPWSEGLHSNEPKKNHLQDWYWCCDISKAIFLNVQWPIFNQPGSIQ